MYMLHTRVFEFASNTPHSNTHTHTLVANITLGSVAAQSFE